MSTETIAKPAAAPEMQKAIVPPPNTSDTSVQASFDQARRDRIAKAFQPEAKPVESKPAEPAKPAEAVVPPVEPVKPKAPAIFEKSAEAKTEHAEAPDPVEAMRLPENATPESVTNFSNLKKVAKEREAEVRRLTRELDQAKKSAGTVPNSAEAAEIEKLRQEHKAATDRLAVLSVQDTPEFQTQFIKPKQQALATAKEVFAYNDKPEPDMTALLAKPMKEFNATVSELIKDMNPADAATITQSLRQARELSTREAAALSNSSELKTQLAAKYERENKQAFDAVATEVAPKFMKREIVDGMSPEERDSAVEYNRSVDSLRSNAEKFAFGKAAPKDVATLAFKAAALDHMVSHAVPYLEREYSRLSSENQTLAAELAKMRGGASPDASRGQQSAATSDTSKMTRDERVAYMLHGAGRPGSQKS